MKHQNYREVNAGFTVEAVFVLPLVLFVIAALLEMSFYLHDWCVIKSTSDDFLFGVCHVMEEEEEELISETWLGIRWLSGTEEEVYECVNRCLEGRLFLCDLEGCSLELQFGKASLNCEASAQMNLPIVEQFLPDRNIRITSDMTIHDPVATIRYEKMIYDEFEKTKLYEQVRTLIDKAAEYIS